jgi:hypothetical protein
VIAGKHQLWQNDKSWQLLRHAVWRKPKLLSRGMVNPPSLPLERCIEMACDIHTRQFSCKDATGHGKELADAA